MKILILGASGAGTSTLGAALARTLGLRHLDTDDYFWISSSPPYQSARDPVERMQLLSDALRSAPDAVVSGSLVGWGDALEDAFDLIVFLYVPTEIRIERLTRREMGRFGSLDPEFIQWASQYDSGASKGRHLAQHLDWLAQRSCPVLRIDGDTTVEDRTGRVMAFLAAT